MMSNLISKISEEREKLSISYPSKKRAIGFIEDLYAALFLFHYKTEDIVHSMGMLEKEFEMLLINGSADHSTVRKDFFSALLDMYQFSMEDAVAIYNFDPAAKSVQDVLNCYPGFFALAIHRIAHICWNLGLHSVARIFSEHVHGKTGIDIHPGAQIGRRLAIDHGTGIVIGETCIIGDDVKIFQGVTLGALSVGKINEDTKRHPTIENRVIIYANATILGGQTVIGENSVIGGNVWLVTSIEKNSTVFNESKIKIKSHEKIHDYLDFVI
ncbi:MAG TPA: serine acetyltransferase [Saprospirales bacterium]|nr:serine acetyltransferase [Saprospirales bacterium]HRQ29928.1 serine O-acetyltransferase [Saprospiraceae bacterium]